MKKAAIAYIIMAVIFAGIGGACGWYLAIKKGPAANAPGGHDDHADHADHAGHDHAAHDDAGDESVLSPQALANMGIEVIEIEEEDFFVYESVPASIAETPLSEQPVTAPIGGIVQVVSPRLGQKVNGGEVVVRLVRDSLPRPELGLTEDLLKPATEQFHSTARELRQALKALEIFEEELDRLNQFDLMTGDGLPLIPRQNLIGLRYERARTQQTIDDLRRELRIHGITEEQLATIQAGGEVDLNLQIWQAVLKRNGIWDETGQVLLKTLDEDQQQRPWVIAMIGELLTQNLLSPELRDWLTADDYASKHFIHISGLLFGGESLTSIRQLYSLGALEPVVEIKAPDNVPAWDVQALLVKSGDHVERGQALLVLGNAREMILEAHPVAGETVALLQALEKNSLLSATPLVTDSGPTLTDLRIELLTGGDNDRSLARIPVRNEVHAVTRNGDAGEYRSWRLRTGLRYMLRVPVRKIPDALVVPADAVVSDGADRVVYVQNGDQFAPAKVVVSYADHEVAVLGEGSEVFAGDPVVTVGAFALSLALRAGDGGAIDPHAGHNH